MRIAIVMLAALSGCVAAGEPPTPGQEASASEDIRALQGRVVGAPQDCIDSQGLSGPQIVDRDTILYTAAGRVWRNKLSAACPSLRPYDTLIVELNGSRICRNDRFRAVQPGTSIPGPFCVLGKFTPYTRAQ